MPDTWTTVAAAAARLGVHVRTIERRIAAGRLQTRRTDAGQLQVLVDMPDTPADAGQVPGVVAAVVDQADKQVQLALGAGNALAKAAQDDANLARRDVDRAWSEAQTARRSARAAWSLVGVMVAGVLVAATVTTRLMTRAQDQADNLARHAGQLTTERDQLRAQLDDARQAQARADGQLAAVRDQLNDVKVQADQARVAAAAIPTTRPSSILQRVASLFE